MRWRPWLSNLISSRRVGYSDVIQEGLLVREQMAYFESLRAMRVPANEGLALLDLAPDVTPAGNDRAPKPRTRKRREPSRG